MNEQSRKWTVERREFRGSVKWHVSGTDSSGIPLSFMVRDERDAIAFAEAGTVASETGLTPRQLADALRECVALLADVIDYRGGAANALADEYVMERLLDFYTKHAALRTEPRT